jgi:hypothetical protein
MVTFWYVTLWIVALAGALGVGLVSHYWHANFQAFPDKLFDGGKLSDTVLNEVMSPEHRLFGHYDSGGWWEFYSWRNYAMHAVPYLILVVVIGILGWEDRAGTLSWACENLTSVGLSPVFCR